MTTMLHENTTEENTETKNTETPETKGHRTLHNQPTTSLRSHIHSIAHTHTGSSTTPNISHTSPAARTQKLFLLVFFPLGRLFNICELKLSSALFLLSNVSSR